jgi:hypothetical protein
MSRNTLPPTGFCRVRAVKVAVLSKGPSICMDENADEASHVGFVLAD